MLDLMDTVKIRENGVVGMIIDIADVDGMLCYAVQSDSAVRLSEENGVKYPIYDCWESELVKLDEG